MNNMKCDCYHTDKKIKYTYNHFAGNFISEEVDIAVCWGTKERSECRCNGDKSKCDFYPELSERVTENIKIQDAITHFKYGISHDIFSEPVTTYVKLAIKALEKQLED